MHISLNTDLRMNNYMGGNRGPTGITENNLEAWTHSTPSQAEDMGRHYVSAQMSRPRTARGSIY